MLPPMSLVHSLLRRALFSAALTVERTVIGAGLRLPFGGSLLVVAARDG